MSSKPKQTNTGHSNEVFVNPFLDRLWALLTQIDTTKLEQILIKSSGPSPFGPREKWRDYPCFAQELRMAMLLADAATLQCILNNYAYRVDLIDLMETLSKYIARGVESTRGQGISS